MPNFSSFKDFGQALDKVVAGMDRGEKTKITRPAAERAQKIAEAAASADLGGDPKFSGWKPELVTQVKFTSDGAAVVFPTKASAGPWTVAEVGRNQGSARGFSGPGIGKSGQTSRTKSGGLRKVRAFKAKRWNGTTKGKHSASKALAKMNKELPEMIDDGFRRLLQKHFDVD